jgi:1,2-diacylglycerol 3-beta-glucosyltransferase
MLLLIQILILLVQVVLAKFVGYLLLLTVAARKASKVTPLSLATPTNRFIILIPAHNEEKLIAKTIQNLLMLDYPSALFSIHVVADNCTDQTAEIAADLGVNVYVRTDSVHKGKGYALQWLIEMLWSKEIHHEAAVILDADSFLSANFLVVMDARLNQGERAIQAYYSVSEPGNSITGSLRYAALALVHFLRPQGRMVLGGSTGLKGNGMVFRADLLKEMVWSASITEDIDQHMALIFRGERVMFTPDALVWGEMPDTLASSESQIDRWESGRLQMARKYIIPLLKRSLAEYRKKNFPSAFILFDAAIEHMIPPFSVLVGLSIVFFVADLSFLVGYTVWTHGILFSTDLQTVLILVNFLLGVWLVIGQFIYLYTGLIMVKAPRIVYKNLLFAPFFVVWKIWHYIRVLLGGTQSGWVRTTRNKS